MVCRANEWFPGTVRSCLGHSRFAGTCGFGHEGGLKFAAIGGAEGDRMLRSVALGDGCHHLLVKSALIGPLVRDERAVWPLACEANGMEPGRALRRDARR